jgi:hypothetical protein
MNVNAILKCITDNSRFIRDKTTAGWSKFQWLNRENQYPSSQSLLTVAKIISTISFVIFPHPLLLVLNLGVRSCSLANAGKFPSGKGKIIFDIIGMFAILIGQEGGIFATAFEMAKLQLLLDKSKVIFDILGIAAILPSVQKECVLATIIDLLSEGIHFYKCRIAVNHCRAIIPYPIPARFVGSIIPYIRRLDPSRKEHAMIILAIPPEKINDLQLIKANYIEARGIVTKRIPKVPQGFGEYLAHAVAEFDDAYRTLTNLQQDNP